MEKNTHQQRRIKGCTNDIIHMNVKCQAMNEQSDGRAKRRRAKKREKILTQHNTLRIRQNMPQQIRQNMPQQNQMEAINDGNAKNVYS